MPSISSFVCAVSALAAAVSAHPVGHDHAHVARGALPGSWFQARDHPAHALFGRQGTTTQPSAVTVTGTTSTGAPTTTTIVAPSPPAGPAVGSAEWKAKYPASQQSPPLDTIPASWINAYKAAVANGLIPSIPPTYLVQTGEWDQTPVYPKGYDAESPQVCSTTVQCYNATDIYKAPAGVIGISFDDGPAEGSPVLYDFLGHNHIRATHFLIGGNIIDNPDLFLQAIRNNGDLAVHTWSHPYMTAQSDLGILAELGWTMQVIYDSTGGRVPRYWRPPYGDADNRVRAIAEHVFGMTAVLWNQDTNDWAMPTDQTAAAIATEVEQWLSGSKSTGLIILEHELNNDTSNVFINTTWPLLQKYQWRPQSIGQMYGKNGFNYANAKDNMGPVTPVTDIVTQVAATGSVPLPTWYSQTVSTSWSTTASSTTTPVPTSSADPQAGGAGGAAPTTTPASGSSSNSSPNSAQDNAAGPNSTDGGNDGAAALSRPHVAFTAVAAVLAAFVMFA